MVNKRKQQSAFKRNLRKLFSNDILVDMGGGEKRRLDVDKSSKSSTYTSHLDKMKRSRQTHLPRLNNSFNRMKLFRKYEQMDSDSIISSALDIYADESTTKNSEGNILSIYSDNKNIINYLNVLYYQILNVDFNLWTWIRTMVKYGDCFTYNVVEKNKGVINTHFISNYDIERNETDEEVKFNLLNGLKVADGNQEREELYNFEVSHFRLLSDNNYLPYGRSLLEGTRKTWEQLILMEDAMLLHRIMRSPERRKYKIDVSGIPPKDVDAYMEEIMNSVKKTPYVDEQTGEYNLRYNLESSIDDIFLPVRGERSGNEVETLSGLDWNGIDDIEYLKNKMMASLKIPKPFLGYDESVEGKCISPETEIPLINGETKKAKTLIENYKNNIKNYVYSLDENTGKIVAGEIEWAGYTRLNTQIVRVWLDNGEYLDTTPDHYFLKRNGEWVQAQGLQPEDSLMPFYLSNGGYKNHKVSNVEWLDDNIDTCDISVKNYHNFGTKAGVIIHNSTLASMDLRFARTIEYIQRIIESELKKIGVIHLYALGFSSQDVMNFTINLTNPSIIYEQEKVSLLSDKIRLAQDMADSQMFSFKEIYERVFGLSEEDLKKNKKDIIQDYKFKFRLEQLEREGNDPQETKQSVGTPHDLAMLNYQEPGEPGAPDGGFENAGRPPEGTKNNTQDHPHGRNSLGQDTYKDVSTKNDKSSKIKHDFKSGKPLALEDEYLRREKIIEIMFGNGKKKDKSK